MATHQTGVSQCQCQASPSPHRAGERDRRRPRRPLRRRARVRHRRTPGERHDGEHAVAGAQVVAVPLAGGNPVAALPLFGDATSYQLVGVSPGNWRVFVEAEASRTRWST